MIKKKILSLLLLSILVVGSVPAYADDSVTLDDSSNTVSSVQDDSDAIQLKYATLSGNFAVGSTLAVTINRGTFEDLDHVSYTWISKGSAPTKVVGKGATLTVDDSMLNDYIVCKVSYNGGSVESDMVYSSDFSTNNTVVSTGDVSTTTPSAVTVENPSEDIHSKDTDINTEPEGTTPVVTPVTTPPAVTPQVPVVPTEGNFDWSKYKEYFAKRGTEVEVDKIVREDKFQGVLVKTEKVQDKNVTIVKTK